MLTPVPPHEVPAGPLAVRWLGYELPPLRAGTVSIGQIELENAGTAPWRSRPGTDIHLSYHWLDPLGNPIVWAGPFILLPDVVGPGERISVPTTVRAPMPPGRYRLAFDLVDVERAWFAELGNRRLELDLDVGARIERRTLAVRLTEGPPELVEATRVALASQEEPPVEGDAEAVAFLAAGCEPAHDWSRRILDAHQEGYAAVAGSVAVEGGALERRRAERSLAAWKPGFGRSPAWSLPLLCPSVVAELADTLPWTEPVAGLPALDPERLSEPWLCDGRVRVGVTARALRRAGRRSA